MWVLKRQGDKENSLKLCAVLWARRLLGWRLWMCPDDNIARAARGDQLPVRRKRHRIEVVTRIGALLRLGPPGSHFPPFDGDVVAGRSDEPAVRRKRHAAREVAVFQ